MIFLRIIVLTLFLNAPLTRTQDPNQLSCSAAVTSTIIVATATSLVIKSAYSHYQKNKNCQCWPAIGAGIGTLCLVALTSITCANQE